jgi:hypothetical protein
VQFRLFSKGDGRGAENVVWRDDEETGHSYRAFDYWYYVEHKTENGSSKTYHRFSCAMVLVGSSWPDIIIEREGFVAKAMNLVAGGDIDFESEEFNRLFAVHCPDRRFAAALLDAQMLDLLLSTKGQLAFEIKGRWLLVWTDPVDPALVPGLLKLTERFVRAIPPVVWELYPSSFVDDHGRPLPPGDDPVSRVEIELAIERAQVERDDGHDPFAVLGRSPFLPPEHDPQEPEEVLYDLDGHPLPKVNEDPWGMGRPPPPS